MPSNLLAKFNRTRVQTLLADLDLALTFTALAASRKDLCDRLRCYETADTALSTIRYELSRHCTLDESEQAEVNAKMQEVEYRLACLCAALSEEPEIDECS